MHVVNHGHRFPQRASPTDRHPTLLWKSVTGTLQVSPSLLVCLEKMFYVNARASNELVFASKEHARHRLMQSTLLHRRSLFLFQRII